MNLKADKVVPIRINSEQLNKLDRLVAAIPGTTRSSLARALLERAIADVETDPSRLIRRDVSAPQPSAAIVPLTTRR
jgi:hypothetical protein